MNQSSTSNLTYLILVCLMMIIREHAMGQVDVEQPYHVFLVSNLEDAKDPEIVEQLITFLSAEQGSFAVVLNGDLGSPGSPALERLISWMADRPADRLLLTQGDRDWADSGPGGWQAVKHLADWVQSFDIPNVFFFQPTGCPDPEIITLSENLQIIGVNTQWFNHPYSKPTSESSQCAVQEVDQFYEQLELLIDEHPEQNILIVGHYPIESNGIYGGRYPLKDWLLPIPIVSGFSTSYKRHVGTPKEMNNPRFAKFRRELRELTLRRSSIIYASGHDFHNEILTNGEGYLVQSGGLSLHTPVKASRETRFRSGGAGFIRLTYDGDGHVFATHHTLGRSGYAVQSDSVELFQPPCEQPDPDLPVNSRFVPCAFQLPTLDEMALTHAATSTQPAAIIQEKGKLGQWLWGTHYKPSWEESIRVPILNLDTTYNGLVPFRAKERKYKSILALKNEAGATYTFSTIGGDPTKQVKLNFRNRIIDVLLRDQTTIRHPYGSLTTEVFLDTLGILHTHSELFVLPDDPKLGQWRRNFATQMGILEELPTSTVDFQFAGADDISTTVSLIRDMYRTPDIIIDKDKYQQARMLDIFLGDWGRSERSWRWAGYEQDGERFYLPIPIERDQVYTEWDGLIPWLADREWAKVYGETFEEDIRDMRSLTWQNKAMDRFLLSEATREDWQRAAQVVQSRITPDIIDRALDRIPNTRDTVSTTQIKQKLLARHKKLSTFADRYYDLLAEKVDIVGTQQDDHFDVERYEDGRVRVTVYGSNEAGISYQTYERLFCPEETSELRLFGLAGDDEFVITGAPDKKINIHVVPGEGIDKVAGNAEQPPKVAKRARPHVYSLDGDTASDEFVMVDNADRAAYGYDRQGHQYNKYLPLAYLKFNNDQGLGLGARVTFKRYRYGQTNFSSRHQIQFSTSTNGNIGLRYLPRFTRRVGKWDIIGRFDFEQARLFNFYFGRGNFGDYDNELRRDFYYSLEQNTIGAGLGLSQEFWGKSEASILINGIYNSDQRRTGGILDELAPIAGEVSTVNLRTDLLLDLDLRDSEALPYYGYRFFTNAMIGTDIRGDGGSFVTGSSFIESHNTFRPISIGVRAGGAINIGDVPYFLNQYLGQSSYLRGFRQNRFLGDLYAFANFDLRTELVNNPIANLPYRAGVRLFCDVAQTYLRGSELPDSDWKAGYGFGFYFVPYKDEFTINLNAGFSREESFLIQFGIGSAL